MVEYGSKTRCDTVSRFNGAEGEEAKGEAYCDGYLNWLRSNGLSAKADAKLSNVTYWTCLLFYNSSLISGDVPEINYATSTYHCDDHNIDRKPHRDPSPKSSTYSDNSTCSNHCTSYNFNIDASDDFTVILLYDDNINNQDKKTNTIYSPTTRNLATALTALYNEITALVSNKQRHSKFSAISVDYSESDKPTRNTEIKTKILSDLYTTMLKFSGQDTFVISSMPSNIEVGSRVNASDITTYNAIANSFILDCVCYSDCNGYSVCYCYGNCNHY